MFRREKRRQSESKHVREKQADDRTKVNRSDRIESLSPHCGVGKKHEPSNEQNAKKTHPRQPLMFVAEQR